MPISSINRVRTITLPLSSAIGSAIVPIYQNTGLTIGQPLIPDHTIISFNCFVKNLKAFAKIDSLPEIALPSFELEDSETVKLYKTLDVEWKSARKQLSLYIASGSSGPWSQVGSTSILNPAGYPFRIYNLMDMFTDNLALELGENSKIGVGIDNVGYGLLQGIDKVIIHGSYVEEIYVETKEQTNINITLTGGGTFIPTEPTPSQPTNLNISNTSYMSNEFLLGN